MTPQHNAWLPDGQRGVNAAQTARLQYCAHDYRRIVESFGMRASMSRRVNCYDNAPMESFWGSLKTELVHHRRFTTRAEAKAAITEWIEVFYNRQRRHSRLGNLAPAVFAQQFYNKARAA